MPLPTASSKAGRPRRTRYRVPVPPKRLAHALLGLERTIAPAAASNMRALRLRNGYPPSSPATLDRHDRAAPSKLRRLAPRRAAFSARFSQSFRNETFVRLAAEYAQCHEDFVDRAGSRAVVRAYKKLPQLYDLTVLVATLDQSQAGVQGQPRRRRIQLRERAAPEPPLHQSLDGRSSRSSGQPPDDAARRAASADLRDRAKRRAPHKPATAQVRSTARRGPCSR